MASKKNVLCEDWYHLNWNAKGLILQQANFKYDKATTETQTQAFLASNSIWYWNLLDLLDFNCFKQKQLQSQHKASLKIIQYSTETWYVPQNKYKQA